MAQGAIAEPVCDIDRKRQRKREKRRKVGGSGLGDVVEAGAKVDAKNVSLSKARDYGNWASGGMTTERSNAMKKVISVLGFGAVVLFGSQAMAQDKITEINFEGDTIEGDLMMPTQSNIAVKELDELSSLIKAREDFVDEMRKTVDEL